MNKVSIGNCTIQLVIDDITNLEVDAIVNPANTKLILGSGVAGAIRQKGGLRIQAECNEIGSTRVGGAVITGGGNLPAKHVIHAVGPRQGSLLAGRKLRQATRNTLKLAANHKLNSIALPAISTGAFGFPLDKCADIMLKESWKFLEKYQKPEKVIYCLSGNHNFSFFEKTLDKLQRMRS